MWSPGEVLKRYEDEGPPDDARSVFFFFQAEDGIRDYKVTGVQTVCSSDLEATRLAPGLPLVAGGKSFGGRMTSTAQAEAPLPGVRGLVFLGFPLHPPGKPDDKRAEHLTQVRIPMLFLQGDRDEFADLKLLKPVVKRLGAGATLHLVEGGDHSFHVLKRSGRTDADVMSELVDAIVKWTAGIV